MPKFEEIYKNNVSEDKEKLRIGRVRSALEEVGTNIVKIENDLELINRLKEIDKYLSSYNSPKFSDYDKPYVNLFFNHLGGRGYKEFQEKALKIIKEKLSNKILVDLGCGGIRSAGTPENLKKLGIEIKSYIGVDRYNAEEHYSAKNLSADKVGIPTIYAEEDMLKFTAMLPDNSVNYLMNGIDRAIIQGDEYWERLTKEIYRSTEIGGIVFGSHADFPQKNPFTDITPRNPIRLFDPPGFFIYEKT